MSAFKTILERYVYGGIPPGSVDDLRQGVRRRAAIVNLFSPIAVILCVVYAYIAFQNPNMFFVGYILLTALATLLLNIPYMRRTKNIKLGSHITVAVAIPIQLSYLVTGGPLGHGYFWSIAWVPWAFLILGRKRAIFWVMANIFSALILLFLDTQNVLPIFLSAPELFQSIGMILVASVLLYLYEQQSEFFESLAIKAIDKLTHEK